MPELDERGFFCDGGLVVTSSRVEVRGKVFELRDVMAVNFVSAWERDLGRFLP